jgi:hypothetical protein
MKRRLLVALVSIVCGFACGSSKPHEHEGAPPASATSTSVQGSLFASITASGDFSSGLDDKDIQGGLIGNDPAR